MAGSGLFNHHNKVDARLQGAGVSSKTASTEAQSGQADTGTSKWMVSIPKVQVSGAGNGACNAFYMFDMMHQGKPLFKSAKGCIVYFNKHWKMNTSFKTTSWLYSVPEANTPKHTMPPEGEWKCIGSSTNSSGAPPVLRLVDELFQKIGEQGSSIELEGGRSVSKREENKTWRWVEIPESGAVDVASPLPPSTQSPQPGFSELSKPSSKNPADVEEVEDVIPSLGALLKNLEASSDGGSADDFFELGRSSRKSESSSESRNGYPSLRHIPLQGSLQREAERRFAMEGSNLGSGSLGYYSMGAAPPKPPPQPSRSSSALGTDAAGFFVPKPAAGGLARRLQKSEKSVLSRRRQLNDSSGILEDA